MIEEEGKKGTVVDRTTEAPRPLYHREPRIDDENDYEYEIQLQVFFCV